MGCEPFTFLLYLFYGLAFFCMGVAVTSKDIGASGLKIAGIFWLFALFAYTHALHEWFELYFILFAGRISAEILPVLHIAKLSLIFISFLALLCFGLALLRQAPLGQRDRYRLLPSLLVALWVAALFFHGLSLDPAFFRYADFRLRNLIGVPAALAAAGGFILFARDSRAVRGRGGRNFAWAGLFLGAYGVLTGLIPSHTVLPLLGVHVELLRGASAFLILHFIMNGLHIFDTERAALIEDRLKRFAQSEKLTAVGKLAAGIAHEINNPLTNISLNVEMLKKGISLPEGDPQRLEKRFSALERNIDRASKIARELLYFSREKESRFVSVDLNEVIHSTLTLLGPRRNDYRIDLDLQPLPAISGLPWKLEEVFLNLLLNAMEASEKGARIGLSTARREGEVEAKIIDSGIGIAPENLNSIFDPFFTTKEVGQGTGLGLAICFGIMQMHGGALEANSTVGKGTEMRLVFPVGGDHGS